MDLSAPARGRGTPVDVRRSMLGTIERVWLGASNPHRLGLSFPSMGRGGVNVSTLPFVDRPAEQSGRFNTG